MKRVLVVFPTAWDRRQLEACRERWQDRYELVYLEPSDEDCPDDFDALGYIERVADEWRGRADGVFSSSDYPGATVAAAIARRMGLAGSEPEHVVRTSHKYYSREVQREAIPEATPPFQLVSPDRPEEVAEGIGFPCFVKPVKGAFSLLAKKVDGLEELRALFARPAVREFRRHYMRIFNQLVRGLTTLEHDGDYFIAEGLVRGAQTTVEGFCADGEVTILGVVDSVMHPGTGSFARFDHPSGLDEAVRARMRELARRVMDRMPLEHSLFNIEMVHDAATDAIHVIEINPRICGQFGDLYAKVDDRSSFELALELATGAHPRYERHAGPFGVASSVPLRIFEPSRVLHAPDAAAIRAVEEQFPGTLVWSECETGQELSDFESAEDGVSARYAVVNTGAEDPAALDRRIAAIGERLGYRFEPL
jgi:biotin carboxylase